MTLENCFLRFNHLKKFPICIDGSNVAYARHNNRNPSLDDITLQLNHLIVDLEFDRKNIYCICDPGLKYHIDKPIEYEALVKEEVIIEAPKVADEFILSFALRHDFCFIISNDKFREYLDQLPSQQWLEDRRISFMFVSKKVCLSPNINYKMIQSLPLKKDKARNTNKKIKKKMTTLDVLDQIEETKGGFDLF